MRAEMIILQAPWFLALAGAMHGTGSRLCVPDSTGFSGKAPRH
jgi:hypothetical protein